MNNGEYRDPTVTTHDSWVPLTVEVQLLIPILAGFAVPTLPAKRMKMHTSSWAGAPHPGQTLPCSPPPEHHSNHHGQQHCQPHDGHHCDDEDGALLTGGHCHCGREAELLINCSGVGLGRGAAVVTAPMASLCPPEKLWLLLTILTTIYVMVQL